MIAEHLEDAVFFPVFSSNKQRTNTFLIINSVSNEPFTWNHLAFAIYSTLCLSTMYRICRWFNSLPHFLVCLPHFFTEQNQNVVLFACIIIYNIYIKKHIHKWSYQMSLVSVFSKFNEVTTSQLAIRLFWSWIKCLVINGIFVIPIISPYSFFCSRIHFVHKCLKTLTCIRTFHPDSCSLLKDSCLSWK